MLKSYWYNLNGKHKLPALHVFNNLSWYGTIVLKVLVNTLRFHFELDILIFPLLLVSQMFSL